MDRYIHNQRTSFLRIVWGVNKDMAHWADGFIMSTADCPRLQCQQQAERLPLNILLPEFIIPLNKAYIDTFLRFPSNKMCIFFAPIYINPLRYCGFIDFT